MSFVNSKNNLAGSRHSGFMFKVAFVTCTGVHSFNKCTWVKDRVPGYLIDPNPSVDSVPHLGRLPKRAISVRNVPGVLAPVPSPRYTLRRFLTNSPVSAHPFSRPSFASHYRDDGAHLVDSFAECATKQEDSKYHSETAGILSRRRLRGRSYCCGFYR